MASDRDVTDIKKAATKRIAAQVEMMTMEIIGRSAGMAVAQGLGAKAFVDRCREMAQVYHDSLTWRIDHGEVDEDDLH